MRVAVFANPTISNIMGSSDYVEFREAVQFIVAKHPDVFFYFCLPERVRQYATDVIPRTKFLFYEDSSFMFYDGQATAPVGFIEMFHTRVGRYPVDAVWTTRTTCTAVLGRQLQDHRLAVPAVPVFIDEFKAIDFEETQQKVSEYDLVVNAMGYLTGYGMFDTWHEYDVAMRACARYLSATALEKVKERSTMIHCGINFEYIAEATKGATKYPEFTVLFGGRMNAAKKTDWIFNCIDQFYSFGRNVKAIMCTPTSGQGKIDVDYPHFEWHWSLSKKEFLRKAAQCHAFCNASPSEGFTVGVVEQLYVGLVGVLPKRHWVKGLLQECYETYPFLYGDQTEMAAKLRWVHDNYEEAKEAMKPVQALIRERYSRKEASLKTYDFMLEKIAENNRNTLSRISGDTADLMKKTTRVMPPKFSLDMFCMNMAEQSDLLEYKSFEAPIRGRPSKYMVYKWLINNGYRDLADSPVPWFERAKK